jgi:hypothetical protein
MYSWYSSIGSQDEVASQASLLLLAYMIADCFRYYKGCEERQKHGDVRLVPVALMHPIIKPWSFRGWGLNLEKVYFTPNL